MPALPVIQTGTLIMALTTHTNESFAKYVEHAVQTLHMTYMDAVLDFCAKHHIEPEMVVPLLTTKIKTGIQRDAQRLHLIKKRRELPFDD